MLLTVQRDDKGVGADVDSCGRAMLNLEIGYIHDQAPSERGDVVSDEIVCEIRWLKLL